MPVPTIVPLEIKTTSYFLKRQPQPSLPPFSETSLTCTRADMLLGRGSAAPDPHGVDVGGGGGIRPTPGVECRTSATQGYTLCPGS